MTAAVDTNLLFDIVQPDSRHYADSQRALTQASSAEPLIVCEAVYAEIAPLFPGAAKCNQFLEDFRITLDRSARHALHLAGTSWRQYSRERRGLTCPSCGKRQPRTCPDCGAIVGVRQHVLADFLIGAHALVHAGRLLTRDRGYYARYFPDLQLA